MFKFDDIYKTSKKTAGKNSCEYIIIHHTGNMNYVGNCKFLSWDNWKASVHFVVWPDGEAAKIWDPLDILWHAWASQWWTLKSMNKYSLWIEVVGPDSEWLFSDIQYRKVIQLIKHLRRNYNIPVENILCHHSVTRDGSKDKKLWDWKSKVRKQYLP